MDRFMFSGGSSNDFDLYKDLQKYYAHFVSILTKMCKS